MEVQLQSFLSSALDKSGQPHALVTLCLEIEPLVPTKQEDGQYAQPVSNFGEKKIF
jgi:hypothetical protein